MKTTEVIVIQPVPLLSDSMLKKFQKASPLEAGRLYNCNFLENKSSDNVKALIALYIFLEAP